MNSTTRKRTMVLFDPNNQYVNSREKLEALDRILIDSQGLPKFRLVAFDTESNGIEFHEKVIIGFSLASDARRGYYVPLLEWVPETKFFKKDKKIVDEVLNMYPNGHFVDVWTGNIYSENVTSKEYQMPDFIFDYLRKWTTTTNLIMHNAAFDCNMVAYNTGLDLTKNLFCDTILLKHTLDENPPHGLKEIAKAWKEELGFNPDEDSTSELKELGKSIIRNGGKFSPKIRHVWRGDGPLVAKYAAADAALTFGVYEIGLKKLQSQYSEKHVEWFFEKEVMPLAREVVIPMTCGGMFVDTEYFKELVKETQVILNRLEDEAIVKLDDLIKECPLGEEPGSLVSNKALYEKIMQIENLEYPTKEEKGEIKQSLARAVVEKAYEKTGHWLFGHILGEDKMQYSPERIEELKEEIYGDKNNGKPRPRYKFNIKSGYHLRWVLFDKLGNDAKLYPQTKGATDEDPEASLAGEILEEHFKGKYPFIDPVIRFLKLHKLISTYARPLIKKQHSGYVHMDMRQFGTTSGRFSCRKPNMQNLPAVKDFGICAKCESKNVVIDNPAKLLANIKCKDCGHEVFEARDPSAIKRGFISPPGYKIVNADFESLEPKCFAFMSGDEGLKAVYKQGLDLYSKVYCDMFDPKNLKYSPDPKSPKFLKKIAPDKRKEVKPIVLGIPYGEDDWKVANELGLMIEKEFFNYETKKTERRMEVNVEEGNRLRNLYLDAYPKLRDYMKDCEEQAMMVGYVETLVGRRRHFKVAPAMWELLNKSGVELSMFMNIPHKKLQEVTIKSLGFTNNDMFEVGRAAGIPYSIIKDNGCWSFLKSKFKNELNNAKNFPIQGLAAHITNIGMIDIMRAFRQDGIEGYVCCQVHDEITCYVREDQVEAAKKIVQRCMEKNWVTALLDIPMKAEPIIAMNLKEAK